MNNEIINFKLTARIVKQAFLRYLFNSPYMEFKAYKIFFLVYATSIFIYYQILSYRQVEIDLIYTRVKKSRHRFGLHKSQEIVNIGTVNRWPLFVEMQLMYSWPQPTGQGQALLVLLILSISTKLTVKQKHYHSVLMNHYTVIIINFDPRKYSQKSFHSVEGI